MTDPICLYRRAHVAQSIACTQDLKIGGHCFEAQARSLFFPKIDDKYCNRIHSSLTAVHCFEDVYVGKQLVAWKEFCAETWLE